MSLALLNRDLSFASADLLTHHTDSVLKKKKDKPMRAQLGTERHGIKKKIRKMKAKNVRKEGKISFKFSEESKNKDKDRTKETLAMLSKLDGLATVSSARIVQHNFDKKRQKKTEDEEETEKDDGKSVLFTDEDIHRMSKEYFLHSKTTKPKYDAWKE